ncbi:MAG: TIGR00730 family Rossman fold protein [Acidimicrobiia bacterium]
MTLPALRPRAVCVYCGSSTGANPRHAEAARHLGRLLAAEEIGVVYGGGAVGLMGILADAALDAGGRVTGVLPRGLFAREVNHPGLTELHEVGSMHERKQLMFDLSGAFVALPGGLGTLEELAEVATWAQLGIHRRPIVVVDVDGFWAPLRELLEGAAAVGFLPQRSLGLVAWVDGVDGLLDALAAYDPPPPESRLSPEEL